MSKNVSTKTYTAKLKALREQDFLSKQDIQNIRKTLRGFNWAANKNELQTLQDELLSTVQQANHAISLDHEEMGREYFKRILLKRGGFSKGSGFEEYSGGRFETGVRSGIKGFRFVGLHVVTNNYSGGFGDSAPVFKVLCNDGTTFEYASIMWGASIVENDIQNWSEL